MDLSYDFIVDGGDGAKVDNPKTPGIDGDPLGPEGNGSPGQEKNGKCTVQAGPGKDGNNGDAAPMALCGRNGGDAWGVIVECFEVVSPTLTFLVRGGNGSDGASGGPGGHGSDGGHAGAQPKRCTDTIYGGVGGASGGGGNAGNAGCGGDAADVAIVQGLSLPGNFASVVNTPGLAGSAGNPGNPGNPGKGGQGTDSKHAADGGYGTRGDPGSQGHGGYSGSYTLRNDDQKGPQYFKITITPPILKKSGCGV